LVLGLGFGLPRLAFYRATFVPSRVKGGSASNIGDLFINFLEDGSDEFRGKAGPVRFFNVWEANV
jgi:hypothetical protein